jgi:predicted ribosome quality control (RQC) complex YloA/Tae2 family protein
VSEDDAHRGNMDDRSVHAFAVKPAPSARRYGWGLTLDAAKQTRPPVPPMRSNTVPKLTPLSDNVRQVECWFSQLASVPFGNVVMKQAMRLLFSGRYAKLEMMNRILTDAARKRTERIEELETQLAQLERQVAHLKQELEPARKAIERAKELEVVAAERAHLVNEKDKELALVRETLAKCVSRNQELEKALAEIGQK